MTLKKLKVDFHTHTADDPEDYIDFSSEELIDRAAELGYDALAITNHNVVTDRPGLEAYAAARGVLLIPGIELTLSNKHVLVINPPFRGRPAISAVEELPLVRSDSSLVIAPHPFYPGSKCLWSKLTENIGLFDAVEFSFFYSRLINRNAPAVEVARAVGKAAGRFFGLPQHLADRVHLFARGGGKEHPFDHRRRQGGQGRAGDDSPVDAADVPDRPQFRAGRPAGNPPQDIKSGDRPSLGLPPFFKPSSP